MGDGPDSLYESGGENAGGQTKNRPSYFVNIAYVVRVTGLPFRSTQASPAPSAAFWLT